MYSILEGIVVILQHVRLGGRTRRELFNKEALGMLDYDNKRQIIDFAIIMILLIIGLIAGKLVMGRYDTWIAFNGTAIGIVAVGELIWWRVKKHLLKK